MLAKNTLLSTWPARYYLAPPAHATCHARRYTCAMNASDSRAASRASAATVRPEEDSNPALVAALRAALDAGQIPFARFMELALYHPEHGYYRAPEARPGRGGDFLTAPELSPFFGQCLARHIAAVWEMLDQPDPFSIVEYGAGGGTLARDILVRLCDEAPACFAATRYELHESNVHRCAAARSLLAAAGCAERARWPARAAELSPVTGLILTNEFVDALPVHRVVGQDGRLLERYVHWDATQAWFAEELAAPSTPRLAAALAAGGVALAEGQSAEINLAASDWLVSAAARLQRGVVLTIDYGYPTAELYVPKRHDGTFLCYFQHTVVDNPYTRVGAQDMTAHVDFGALERAGAAASLQTLGLTEQSQFLIDLGLGDLLVASQTPGRALDAYLADRSAVLALIDPGGMGRFRVLAQGKNFTPARPLPGFAGRV
jgi:SAM-dependent MidA family methyltransferase